MNARFYLLSAIAIISMTTMSLSSSATDNKEDENNASSVGKVIVLEGVVQGGKGYCLYEDGINGKKMVSIADESLSNLWDLRNKKVRFLGAILKNNEIELKKQEGMPQRSPESTFYVIKVLSVSESEYEKDLVKLEKVVGEKTLKLEIEDEPLGKLIDKINSEYSTPKIKLEPPDLRDKITLTYFTDQSISGIILFLCRFNLNIIFKEDYVILKACPLQGVSGNDNTTFIRQKEEKKSEPDKKPNADKPAPKQ